MPEHDEILNPDTHHEKTDVDVRARAAFLEALDKVADTEPEDQDRL